MTEEEARNWLVHDLNVSRETMDQLETYVTLVAAEQKRLNLISASTLPIFWSRHIVDAAQLVTLANRGKWLDIGSGAGVPGIVTAILTGAPTILVEPRLKRAAFLENAVRALGLTEVTVIASAVQRITPFPIDTITARAVASLPKLIALAQPFSHDDTVWLFPKGKTAQHELALLPDAWQSHWTCCASVTDPGSQILIGHPMKVTSKR